jgi:hypothetical protein
LPPVVWELVFMMIVLKIPILYLCAVVWWAIRAEPRPLEGAAIAVPIEPELDPAGPGPRPPTRHGPRRGPERGPVRSRRQALARAEARR